MRDGKLCVCTVVSGWYLKYVKLWEECIRKSYPQYDTEIVYCTSVPKYNAACLRFTQDFRSYNKFADFFYITDVDMLIMREEPALCEFHIDEMVKSGLPYSNTLRSREGENRFTGLHFCNRKYFDLTENARNEAHLKIEEGVIGTHPTDDEVMLKDIIDSMCLHYPPKRHLVNRHHGIHLGVFRDAENVPWNEIKRKLDERINRQRAEWWLTSLRDPHFKMVVEETAHSDKRIEFQLNILYKYCMVATK